MVLGERKDSVQPVSRTCKKNERYWIIDGFILATTFLKMGVGVHSYNIKGLISV